MQYGNPDSMLFLIGDHQENDIGYNEKKEWCQLFHECRLDTNLDISAMEIFIFSEFAHHPGWNKFYKCWYIVPNSSIC